MKSEADISRGASRQKMCLWQGRRKSRLTSDLVFEGFMDFLSAVTLGVTGNADCLVLTLSPTWEKAAGLLDGYGRIGCFLDRDEAGRRTLDALAKRYGAHVADRSSLYDGCKDLNEYLQRTTKKQKNNHLKIEEQ